MTTPETPWLDPVDLDADWSDNGRALDLRDTNGDVSVGTLAATDFVADDFGEVPLWEVRMPDGEYRALYSFNAVRWVSSPPSP